MKHRIKAILYADDGTYTNPVDTIEYNLYDNQKWISILRGFGGITLSKNCVCLKRSIHTSSLIPHETIHVIQARDMGWKYLPTYIWQAVRGLFNREKIPMEIEAYAKQHLVIWQKLDI